MINRILRKLNPLAFHKILKNCKILSHELGQWKSIKTGMCIDVSSNPIPWYTYPAIEYLSQFDFSNKSIFEYGSGNSSQFWGSRAKELISVEHNRDWFELVNKKKLNNQQIILMEDEEGYSSYILKLNRQFDVIIIDGQFRYTCVRNSIKCLKVGGMVILDNSDWYPNVSSFLRDNDLIEVDFSGFGPVNNYTWTTSLYLTRDFRFRSLNPVQPVPPIGSLKTYAEDDN